ncbi:MAG: superinfection immunity protein [Proteobacteria bacterium]|nr:superinfection immunity protein [Pseudomonadota bacterium]MDA1058398.1 superinfection immunity protein [Pseudomonadota bacterium]
MTGWQLMSMLMGSAILGPVFFLPTLIAISRKHPRVFLIALFNGMFAWTIIAWVALLIWATIPPKKLAGA